MNRTWEVSDSFTEAVRVGGVTVVLGMPGSGKTVATSVLASMARGEGRSVQLIEPDRQRSDPIATREVEDQLLFAIDTAANRDLIIVREVFESDAINLDEISRVIRKRDVTVLIEMQLGDLRAFRDQGCDLLLMRMKPSHGDPAEEFPGIPALTVIRIRALRTGHGIMVPHDGPVVDIFVERPTDSFTTNLRGKIDAAAHRI